MLYGDVGRGKTHLAIAIGMLACQRMIPVRFLAASSLVMRLRKAKDDNRSDAELKSIGRGRAGHHRRARPPAHRHRRGQAPVPGRRGQLRDPQRHLRLEPRVRQIGRRVRRRGHGRRGHRPHRPPRQDPPLPRRIPSEQTLPHEINQTNNKTRNQPPTAFNLNADGVQIKRRTRPPQFDEIHCGAWPCGTRARPRGSGPSTDPSWAAWAGTAGTIRSRWTGTTCRV